MKRFLTLLIIFSLFALPLHAGVTGSVSLANSRLSLVDGTAFVDFSAAGTLTPYIGGKLTLTDSAGKKAVGYIKAAGTGETLSEEKLANTAFADTTGWVANLTNTIASVAGGQSGNCLEITRAEGTYQMASPIAVMSAVVGELYKFGGYVKSGTAGNTAFQFSIAGAAALSISGTSSGDWTQYLAYRSDTVTNCRLFILKNNTTAGTMLFDEVTMKQVLTPSATGVTIVSTRGGTTYNWASIEAGFNYNDSAGYTYTIIPRFVGGGLGMGIIYGF